jgi:hypothetical protein
MDWDDEDEKTSIYDRGGGPEDAARALLSGSVPPVAPPPAAGAPPPMMMSHAPPPPPPVPSRMPAPPTRPTNRPPPPPPPMAQAPAMPQPMPMPQTATVSYPGRSGGGKSGLFVIVAAALVVAAVLVYFFLPRTGSLVVTVSGPGNKPLDAVDIIVNDKKADCPRSPCTLNDLKADTYYVRAHAAGYQAMADVAIAVGAGSKAVSNLTLVRALGTGIKVIGEGVGLKLYLDGREVGPLPQEIKDMEPGEHLVRVAGSERFEAFEKRINVEPEQMQTIGPLRLRVLKGLATIQAGPGAEGAKVILNSGSDRRTLPKLPITLDIPTNQPHVLVATKRGYEQVRVPIKFEDGQVEKTIELNMTASGGGSEANDEPTSPSPGRSPGRSGGSPSGSSGSSSGSSTSSEPSGSSGSSGSSASSGGSATLNMNSIPVSMIILDGRPIGNTPKVGVKVGAGVHSVVFVKDGERKAQTVNVPSGATKTVAVRF